MPLGPNGGLLVYTIYERPLDFPDAPYIVRPFEVSSSGPQPLPYVWRADTLEQARTIIPPDAEACFLRGPDDDDHIIETWM